MTTLRDSVALFTDIHANQEAMEAIITDIKKRNIKYIVSLGDLVGLGPNPKECMDLAIKNNIINITGNNDCYNFMPLNIYSHLRDKTTSSYANAIWTKKQLTKSQINYLKIMPYSLDLEVNGKKIALCHFPCDIRYNSGATWIYDGTNTDIFFTTNTKEDRKYEKGPKDLGVKAADKDPLFAGKKVNDYDAILYGHYHFEQFHENTNPKFYSLNAGGVAINKNTYYYILSPSKDGYNIERVSIPYDYQSLFDKLDKFDYPKKDVFENFISKNLFH